MSDAKQVIGGSQHVLPHAVVPAAHCWQWPSTHVLPDGQHVVPQRVSPIWQAGRQWPSTQSWPLSQHVPPQMSPYSQSQWSKVHTNGGSQQTLPQPTAPDGQGAQPWGVQCSPSAQHVSMQNVPLAHVQTPLVPNTWQSSESGQQVSPHWVVPGGQGEHTGVDDWVSSQ
jgi:hypothetical protein